MSYVFIKQSACVWIFANFSYLLLTQHPPPLPPRQPKKKKSYCSTPSTKKNALSMVLYLNRNHLFNYKLYARVLFLIRLGAGVLQIVLLLWSFLLPLELPLNLLFISLLFFVAVSCVHHHEHPVSLYLLFLLS